MRNALVVVVLAVSSSACLKPAAEGCSPASCTGCCTAAGACEPGNAVAACGTAGNSCRSCDLGASCVLGTCSASSGGGGGGSLGGGGGTVGGGGGTVGGGGGALGGGGGALGGGGGGGGGVLLDGGVDCIEDTDCPDPLLFFCNTVTSRCEPSCRTSAQCTAAARGPYALPYCDSNPLGCQCDEGLCKPALCATDSQCTGQVCRNGACVAPPAVSTVARCEVSPSLTTLRAGATQRFSVLAWDAAGAPVVLTTGVTWSALGASVSLTTANGAPTAVFTAQGTTNATAPSAAVRATLGSITCDASALVFGAPVPAGSVEVMVTDALTGRPLSGVTVIASDVSSGAVLAGPLTTSAAGWARLSGLSVAAVSVTAFHADFDYLTIAGYQLSGTRALAMPLQRSATTYGGRKGTLTGVPASSNAHVGNSGLSFGASYTEISQASLQGPPVMTHVVIGSAINTDMEFGSGVFLGFGSMPIKPVIASYGAPGTCTLSGVPDEARIQAGTCGTRTAWSFAGDLPLGDIPIDAFAAGGDPDWPLVLQRAGPLFKKLSSSVTRDVEYSLRPTPRALDGGFDYSDMSQLTQVDQPWGQVPFGLARVANVPDLPRFGGAYLDDAVLLTGALVPERGFVPLGAGAGLNRSPVDAKLDVGPPLTTPGYVQLRLAPPHHGLEGFPSVITVHARSPRTMVATRFATAGLVMRVPATAPTFDLTGSSPLTLPAFAALPEGALWSSASRAFGFASPLAISAESVVRVSFGTAAGPRWTVVVSPSAPAFTLPAAPGGFVDRTQLRPGGPDSPVRAEVLRLVPEQQGATVSFAALVEMDSVDLDDLLTSTVAFSVVEPR